MYNKSTLQTTMHILVNPVCARSASKPILKRLHGRFTALRKGELGGSTERYLARACFAHRPFRLLIHLRSFAAAKLCGSQTLGA